LAWVHGLEAFRLRGLLGGLIAFIGILIGIGTELGTTVPILPILAVVAGAACIAEASVLYKLFPKGDALATNAVAMSIGAIGLLVLSLVVGETWTMPASSTTWIALAYLVIIGSVVLFYLYLFVLDRWTATATSYSILLTPVVTVIIAAWLTDEVVTPYFLLGGVMVLLGVWVGAIAQPK
jgi:drug/metabolite transporter (DMT)-like permease